MELYHLKTFLVVAEEENMTRASERLHVSLPSVSAHIKALEQDLGIKLFQRSSKGLRLTQSGKLVLEKARIAVAAADEVIREAGRIRGEAAGTVRIGLNTDAWYLRLPELQELISVKYPALRPSYVQSQSEQIAKSVRRGELDGGFAYGRQSEPGIINTYLSSARLGVIGPVGWRDKVENASVEELADMPWIIPPAACAFCEVGFEMFRKIGVSPRVEAMADSEDVLRELVMSGRGLAFMRAIDAEKLEEEGRICMWKGGAAELGLYFVSPEARKTDPEIAALVTAVRNVWEKQRAVAA